MLSSNPDSKSVNTQPPPVPGWRPATVARLLREQPRTSAEALDEMDRHELQKATEMLVRAKKLLSFMLVRIMEALLSFANRKTGRCNPSCATIAEKAGCSVRSVERHMPTLRDLGLIDWDNQWRSPNGRRKPPKKTSNSYTFARIALGHGAEFVAAKLLSPALEKLATARKAATSRIAAIRAKAANTDQASLDLSERRKTEGADALRQLLDEFRQPSRILRKLSAAALGAIDHTKNAW